MKTLLKLLFFCHVAAAVKHSLKSILTANSGVPNFPEFVGVAVVDGIQVGYCDSNGRTAAPTQDWMRHLIKDDPTHLDWYTMMCLDNQYFLRANIDGLKRRFNQTGGAHLLQSMNGCEWDDETGEVTGFIQYGYDGEDFIALDLQTLTWTAPKQQAYATKLRWDTEKARLEYDKYYLIHKCPEWLRMYMRYGRSFLQRTELPSVSLLQKSPSSPVSCHATGFYPDRVVMFWRKDGVERRGGVDLGEVLRNHDGSFQMSVDLNLSSVAPDDWPRYDCVFHRPGVEDDVVTRLDGARVRTNWVPPSEFPSGAVAGVVVVLLLLLLLLALGVAAFSTWRRHEDGFRRANTSESSSSSDQNSAPA